MKKGTKKPAANFKRDLADLRIRLDAHDIRECSQLVAVYEYVYEMKNSFDSVDSNLYKRLDKLETQIARLLERPR